MNRDIPRTALPTLAVILATAAALAYVTAPPKGLDGYRERAAAGAETLGSQVESASLWVETHAAGRAITAATLVGLEEAEEDAEAAASKFEAYEPPSGTASLRAEFVSLTGDTNEALSRLRIAAQQERWEELPDLAAPLPRLSNEWSRFEERAEP